MQRIPQRTSEGIIIGMALSISSLTIILSRCRIPNA